MTERLLEHHAGLPWLKEESAGDFACHAQLSVRGKRVLDRLLVLLQSHLKSQPTSRASAFPPTLLFSICDALQLDHADSSAEKDDPSVLPSVLSKLRDWRLLDPDYRHSPGGVYKLALDLASITDEASASTSSDLKHTLRHRLRVKWVSSDSPTESQDRESASSAPPSPSSPRSSVLDVAQECAYTLPDLNERRSDAGHESCQAGRLGTPDSEDASAVVSPRHRSVSGFRSGCSACRHLRLSGLSIPPSPHMASMPFSDVNQFTNIKSSGQASPRPLKPSVQHTSAKRTRRERSKSKSQSTSRGAHVDENEPPLPRPTGIQQSIGISFPRQRTHSPRISNTLLLREPFSPVATSVQRRLEPGHLLNPARQGDKHTVSHRVASVDLQLSMPNPSSSRASPKDLHPHPPTRAQSLSYMPVNSHGLGSVGAGVPKLSSKTVGSQSSKRLPSWSQTHLASHPTTTASVKPAGSLSSPPANPRPLPLGGRSRPSSTTSIPRNVPSGMKHRDRRSVSSQTHKYTSSLGALGPSPASPLMHARKWQS